MEFYAVADPSVCENLAEQVDVCALYKTCNDALIARDQVRMHAPDIKVYIVRIEELTDDHKAV